jgi:hypothetical protein
MEIHFFAMFSLPELDFSLVIMPKLYYYFKIRMRQARTTNPKQSAYHK